MRLASGNPVVSPGWRLIVRLVLEITKANDGRYEGRLTVPGTGARHDFSGILELLAILEEQLGPEDARHAGPENSVDPPRIIDEHGPS
jgi:hypothetical protein